jgi:hypothetical protein
MAFKRFLNQTAFNRAKGLKEHFSNWQSTQGSIVHLRPDNCVAFYFMGQKAFELGKLGATDEYTRVFQKGPVKGVDAAALQEQLKTARRAVIDDIKKNKKAGLEPARQAALAWELLRRNKEFTLLDEQVQIPQDALAGKAQEQTRADLLLFEQKTGLLALIELKLSEDPDLDGAVAAELGAARSLPGAIKGGEKIFIQHYRQLFAQKAELGLVGAALADIKGMSGKGLIILGEAAAAYGRLACLDAAAVPENSGCALLAAAAPLKEAAFLPLKEQIAAALAGPRAAYAPRQPRANAFTRRADAEQAVWGAIKPKPAQAGAFDNLLTSYSKKNGLALHTRAEHPRNSQTACAQALAPVFAGNESAVAGLLRVLNDQVAPSWGVKIGNVEECHFEVPHAPLPGDPGLTAFPKADIKALTGETGRARTSLDAALIVNGTKAGREVRALIGVEFKYAEAEFAPCAGFAAPDFAEPGRQACLNGQGRGGLCQLRCQRKLPAFDTENLNAMFAAPNPVDAPGGACLLLGPVNQLYRSHFAVLKLKEQFFFEEALFLVLYDERNQSLVAPERPSPENRPAAGPLQRYKESLADRHKPTFAHLPVQRVIAGYAATITKKAPPWLTKIKSRYNW